jgi:hypothetical protein
MRPWRQIPRPCAFRSVVLVWPCEWWPSPCRWFLWNGTSWPVLLCASVQTPPLVPPPGLVGVCVWEPARATPVAIGQCRPRHRPRRGARRCCSAPPDDFRGCSIRFLAVAFGFFGIWAVRFAGPHPGNARWIPPSVSLRLGEFATVRTTRSKAPKQHCNGAFRQPSTAAAFRWGRP